jgi:hypothetical protein
MSEAFTEDPWGWSRALRRMNRPSEPHELRIQFPPLGAMGASHRRPRVSERPNRNILETRALACCR